MLLLWISGLLSVTCVSLSFFWHLLRRKLLLKETCVEDIKFLGDSRPADKKLKGTVVVCGGSIGGLLAARVCHDHFEKVIVVEPESWLSSEDAIRKDAWNQQHSRSRVMQYNSLQAVQVFGFMGFCKLFPNFVAECKASDIHVCAADFRIAIWGNWTQTPYDMYNGDLPKTIVTSRAGLETLLRRLVLDKKMYPNITQIVGTVVGAFRSADVTSKLAGVTVRQNDGGDIMLNADLVIDCTGPASSGIKWLRREGFGHAPNGRYPKDTLPLEDLKIQYDQKIHYATLTFHVTKELGERLALKDGWDNCGPIYNCITDHSVDNRTIYCQRVDGDCIQVCCGAWGPAELPNTLEEIKIYARSLITDKPIPDWFFEILDLLGEVEDTMTCSKVRVPATNFTRFEKAVNLPSNWIALGDSVMRVNPVFGQGCTKALFGAICLNNLLKDAHSALPENFSQSFFRQQADKIVPVWEGVKTGDYDYETTVPVEGETLSKGALLRWYIRKLHILSFTDKQAGSALWHLRMFLAPQIDLLQFGLVMKVLWNALLNPKA